jgi:hypothetical protein
MTTIATIIAAIVLAGATATTVVSLETKAEQPKRQLITYTTQP